MPTNKLLNYLLWAVLFILLGVAGWKACQMKLDEKKREQEQAELDQALRDMGYPLDEDSLSGTGYTGGDVDYNTPASGAADQNIYDQPATKSPAPQSASPYDQPATGNGGKVVDYSNVPEPSDGRYRVVAGSFKYKANARRQMEKVIQMGYQDAEVGIFNRGAYAVVIVKRTNSMNEANRIANALKDKGIDAAVIDRNRK